MKLKKKTLRGYQKIHAKKRAQERFGVNLTSEEYEALCKTIKNNGAHLIKKLSNTRSIFNLCHKGKDLFAVYNKTTGRIVTFLSLEYVCQREGA